MKNTPFYIALCTALAFTAFLPLQSYAETYKSQIIFTKNYNKTGSYTISNPTATISVPMKVVSNNCGPHAGIRCQKYSGGLVYLYFAHKNSFGSNKCHNAQPCIIPGENMVDLNTAIYNNATIKAQYKLNNDSNNALACKKQPLPASLPSTSSAHFNIVISNVTGTKPSCLVVLGDKNNV